jgi:tetratricopeptide (TPR) repeat protein
VKTPVAQPAPIPAATVSEFIATFAVVLAVILALFLFDSALARVDIRGRKSYAAREFRMGEQLLGQGKIAPAIEHLRTASMLDDDNSAYATALAQAILADGRPDAAEQLLLPLLERDPTDGAANLAMARVLAQEGRIEEAKSYYHRAIYGLWPGGAHENRIEARFELIDLLAKTNARQELLAELLPIQDDSANTPAQRMKIAHLFVVAGSPQRAVAIFRELLRRNKPDAAAYVGLAEAALSLGDFATARADLIAAQKLTPDDSTALQGRIAIADSVIALDPTQLGLSQPEQYRRARNLVQMTLKSTRSCLAAQAPQVAVALDSASAFLVSPAPADGRAQSIQQALSVAQSLWGLQRTRCAAAPPDGVLALIQNRIAQ